MEAKVAKVVQAVPALLLVLLIGASACAQRGAAPPLSNAKATTASIPDTSVKSFRAELAGQHGRPLVVNYWATWCTNCYRELPRFAAAWKKYRARVAFMGVDVQDDPREAAHVVSRFGLGYRHVGDPEKKIMLSERIFGLPATEFYDARGALVFLHHGEITTAELRRRIDDLFPRTP